LADLDVHMPEGNYTTIAGLILEQLGYLPSQAGVSVEVAGRRLEVVDIEGRTVTRVRIHPATERRGQGAESD
jgi:putative hemolysin